MLQFMKKYNRPKLIVNENNPLKLTDSEYNLDSSMHTSSNQDLIEEIVSSSRNIFHFETGATNSIVDGLHSKNSNAFVD